MTNAFETALLQIHTDLLKFEQTHDVYEQRDVAEMGFVFNKRCLVSTTIDADTRQLIRLLLKRISEAGVNYHKKNSLGIS